MMPSPASDDVLRERAHHTIDFDGKDQLLFTVYRMHLSMGWVWFWIPCDHNGRWSGEPSRPFSSKKKAEAAAFDEGHCIVGTRMLLGKDN